MNHKEFQSKHFDTQELSEGVYAAIAIDGQAAISNAGLLDLGGLIIAFDTFLTPRAAKDLSILSAEKFVHRPQLLVNSHYHNDHIWGNQALLPKAQMICSSQTRELILTEGKKEYDWYFEHAEEKFLDYQLQLQTTQDPKEQKELRTLVGYYKGMAEAMPSLQVKVPAITFTDHLEIHGEKHTAHLVEFTGGHTGSDTVLYLPHVGIVFMSNLLFVGSHPYMVDGDPQKWRSILEEISQWNAKTLVPGHGPVGNMDDVKQLIEYIDHCFDQSKKLIKSGIASEEDVARVEIPQEYGDWQSSGFYRANLNFLIKSFSMIRI